MFFKGYKDLILWSKTLKQNYWWEVCLLSKLYQERRKSPESTNTVGLFKETNYIQGLPNPWLGFEPKYQQYGCTFSSLADRRQTALRVSQYMCLEAVVLHSSQASPYLFFFTKQWREIRTNKNEISFTSLYWWNAFTRIPYLFNGNHLPGCYDKNNNMHINLPPMTDAHCNNILP